MNIAQNTEPEENWVLLTKPNQYGMCKIAGTERTVWFETIIAHRFKRIDDEVYYNTLDKTTNT